MRETWKGFHRKQDPLANQSQTRGHEVCHAATKQSMREQNPKRHNRQKKKKSFRIPVTVQSLDNLGIEGQLIDQIIPPSSIIIDKDEEDSQIRPASNGHQTRTN